MTSIRGDHFQFDLVFIKKNSQTEIFLKKINQNLFKPTGFGSVFFDKNRFKPVWLGFFV